MPRTRKAFTDELKLGPVKLVKRPGARVTHIARTWASSKACCVDAAAGAPRCHGNAGGQAVAQRIGI